MHAYQVLVSNMRTSTKWIAALSVVALAGVGVVAAQSTTSDSSGGPGGWFRQRGPPGPPAHAIFALCDDNITVGECKELLQAKAEERRAEVYAKCVERHSEEFCDELKEATQERHGRRPHGPPPAADKQSEESASSSSSSTSDGA